MVKVIDNKFSTILGARRLKISQVAKGTGISRVTLTQLYYGRTTQISFEVLDKLCSYVQCDVGDLLEFKK